MSLVYVIAFIMQVNGVQAMVFPVASPQFSTMDICVAKVRSLAETFPKDTNMGCIGVAQSKPEV
jgi:hypothetical protein